MATGRCEKGKDHAMSTQRKARRVLTAEDNMATGVLIRFCLEKAGFDATHVNTGLKAWELLQREDFDLLVTDFQMPGLPGPELCTRIRQDPRLARLPIIGLTAKGLEIDSEHYLRDLGMTAMLMKPFSPSELMRLVKEKLVEEGPEKRHVEQR
jgi:two-component system, chemotaxis family, chemotaxis protein CheY